MTPPRVVALAVVVLLLTGSRAAAWEPDDWERRERPLPPSPAPDPAPFVVPEGLYYVTETYAGDVVTTDGLTTSYTTATVHDSPGTYARVVETVATGATSSYDGASFNGRAALSDGRSVSGTYYENFVLTSNGYLSVSFVFFQDDAETRRIPSPAPHATPLSPTQRPLPPPALSAAPSPARTLGPSTPLAAAPTAAPAPTPARSSPSAHVVTRAGVALAPDGPMLAAAEVLRARQVPFWPRAYVNDAPVRVRSWRLISQAPDYTQSLSGTDGPFVAAWLRMPAPETSWVLRFEVVTDVAPSIAQVAAIAIIVRAPALVD